MSLVQLSVVLWRMAALTVWLVIAVGAVEILTHIFRPHRRRHWMLK